MAIAIVLTCVARQPSLADTQVPAGAKFGNWTYRCEGPPGGKQICGLTNDLLDDKTKKPFGAVSLTHDDEANGLVLIATVPLGIELISEVWVRVDDGDVISLPLVTCIPPGCLARLKAKPTIVDLLKSGKAFELSFKYYKADQRVSAPGELQGLAEGMDATGLR